MKSKSLLTIYWYAIKLFSKKRGTTLAAASTFYAIISIVPLLLLIVRAIGMVVGDLKVIESKMFMIAAEFFPNVAPELLTRVREIIAGPLFGGSEFTFLNFIILAFSGLSFFNSIWSGLYLITEDRSMLSLLKNLKGLAIIGFTVLLTTLMLFLPAMVVFIINLLKDNILMEFLRENFEILKPTLDYISSSGFGLGLLMKSNIINFIIFLLFFTLLYRWFFSWRISFKNAFLGSLSFVVSLLLGKSVFWIYFFYVRDGLMRNYGDYYTFILGLMWLFFMMCFFFYGACLCYELEKNPWSLKLPEFKKFLEKRHD